MHCHRRPPDLPHLNQALWVGAQEGAQCCGWGHVGSPAVPERDFPTGTLASVGPAAPGVSRVPHLCDTPRAGAATWEPGPVPGLTLPGDTRFLLGSARDGWTDGQRRSWSRAGIPAVHLVAGYWHARCSAVRLLAPLLHSRPAPTTRPPATVLPGGFSEHRPSAPGRWVPPLPPAAVVTAPGFAWQRPGPAELPAHRRPDRQDWRLRALALQVQSKAGLGEEGAGGCAPGPRGTHTYTHTHTTPSPAPPPPRTPSPLPSSTGAAPSPLGFAGAAGGGLSCRPPCEGFSVPQDQAAPQGCPPRLAAPPEHERGVCSPANALAPCPAECNAAGAPRYCLGWPGRAPLPGPGRCRQLPARQPGGCRSVLPALSCPRLLAGLRSQGWGWGAEQGRWEEAVGLEGAQDGEMGGSRQRGGRMHWEAKRRGGCQEEQRTGLGAGVEGAEHVRGAIRDLGCSNGWLGRAGGGGARESSCRGVAGPLRVGLTFSSRTDPAYLAGRLLRDGRPAVGAAALDRA